MRREVRATDRILILGNGNSNLPFDLRAAGYTNITATDRSVVVTNGMACKAAAAQSNGGAPAGAGTAAAEGEIRWVVADMLALCFKDGEFDVVIEKVRPERSETEQMLPAQRPAAACGGPRPAAACADALVVGIHPARTQLQQTAGKNRALPLRLPRCGPPLQGTFDVLMVDNKDPWDPCPSVRARLRSALAEAHRVLSPSGCLLSITFAGPHFRRPLLLARSPARSRLPPFGWLHALSLATWPAACVRRRGVGALRRMARSRGVWPMTRSGTRRRRMLKSRKVVAAGITTATRCARG